MAYKVVLIGHSGVGKTAIKQRFVDEIYTDNHVATIGDDYAAKTITLNNGADTVKMNIWDTAGQERFRSLTRSQFRDAHAFLLVYDITDPATFEGLQDWIKDIKNYARADTLLSVVGNKADLVLQSKVSPQKAQDFAVEHRAQAFLVSAKTNVGVVELFTNIANRLWMLRSLTADSDSQVVINPSPSPSAGVSPTHTLTPITKPSTTESKKGCCALL